MEAHHPLLKMLALSWLFNILSLIDKSTVSFVLGVVTSLLAITCYIIRIRQDLKKDNREKNSTG